MPSRCPRCVRVTADLLVGPAGRVRWINGDLRQGGHVTGLVVDRSDRVIPGALHDRPLFRRSQPGRVRDNGLERFVVRRVSQRGVQLADAVDLVVGCQPGPPLHRVSARMRLGVGSQAWQPRVQVGPDVEDAPCVPQARRGADRPAERLTWRADSGAAHQQRASGQFGLPSRVSEQRGADSAPPRSDRDERLEEAVLLVLPFG
jgi:hypothetical protein